MGIIKKIWVPIIDNFETTPVDSGIILMEDSGNFLMEYSGNILTE